jgi:curved DNA-binding protein CbpA
MARGAPQQPSHYEVLGVPRDAAPEAIRAAYRAAALRMHPDKTQGNGGAALSADAGFPRLQQAWEVWACMLLCISWHTCK